jgi:hypothetical protein
MFGWTNLALLVEESHGNKAKSLAIHFYSPVQMSPKRVARGFRPLEFAIVLLPRDSSDS